MGFQPSFLLFQAKKQSKSGTAPIWSPFYGTNTLIFFRCKQEITSCFLPRQRGGKDETYVYYTIYFIYWNTSFERRDGKSEL